MKIDPETEISKIIDEFHKIFKDYTNGVDKVRRSGIIPSLTVKERQSARNTFE